MSTTSPKSAKPVLLAAALAAIGASVCCVVPLLLVLMGISGAWIAHLTAMDAWRPWFSAAALFSLGLAAWQLYRPSARCETDGVCTDPALLRRRRRWFWLSAVLIASLLLFPYYAPWIL